MDTNKAIVNKSFAKIFDRYHLQYSVISSQNPKVQLMFGYKKVIDNPPEVREGYISTFDGFDEDDATIFNTYKYTEELKVDEVLLHQHTASRKETEL